MSKEEIKKGFGEACPFINRKKEKQYLSNYFESDPENILFIYGPKSCGKSTLLTKVIEKLDPERYYISHLDLRGVYMKDFIDFKNIFFTKSKSEKVKSFLKGIKVGGSFFSYDPDEEAIFQNNIFDLMISKLKKINQTGIKPVIIIDEFQYLKDIYDYDKNGKEVPIINELWKFFIKTTKVQHLAHVVCLTSDSYYMEELYNDTKLANTSEFYLVHHLEKKDIDYRLEDLEKMPRDLVDYVWDNLGGSVWEIWQAFVHYKNNGKKGLEYRTQDMIQTKKGQMVLGYHNGKWFNEKEREKFLEISKEMLEVGYYNKRFANRDFVTKMIDHDIRFYNTKKNIITFNSVSVKKAVEMIFAEY